MTDLSLSSLLGGRSFDDCKAAFDRDGYIIFERVLSPAEIAAQRAALQPHLEADIQGRNDFEGLKTNRVYAMLGKDPIFADLITHPLALAFVEADLGPNALLSACLAINLHPGETVQLTSVQSPVLRAACQWPSGMMICGSPWVRSGLSRWSRAGP